MNRYMAIETVSGISLMTFDKVTTWKRALEIAQRMLDLGKLNKDELFAKGLFIRLTKNGTWTRKPLAMRDFHLCYE